MKLVKIFGAVMAVHAAVFMFVFAIPGCRSTGKKTTPATAPVIGAETTPVDAGSPIADPGVAPAEVAPVRFSPTRPGTAAAIAAEAPPAEVAPSTYAVVKGDSLWSIAKKHNITVKQLTAANNLRADSTLKLGQALKIPGKAAAPAAATTSAATVAPVAPAAVATAATTHVVKSGESLGGIAKKYQVKVGDIAAANNIADPTKIRVGQTLKIPGSHTKSSVKSPAPSKAPAAVKPAPAVAPTPAPTPAAPVEQPAAPVSPLFTSPLVEPAAPTPAPATSPFVSSAAAPDNTGAPVIRVEESGALKVE